MKSAFISGLCIIGAAVFLAGCDPNIGRGPYGRGYDPYYGGPYRGGYDPYDSAGGYYGGGYGARTYDPYYGSSPYYGGGYYSGRSHEEEHEHLEHKYDKAMNRLDRQEREAEEKALRKSGGNPNDPRYREADRKIDQKYDYKRGKVERNLNREHQDFHRDAD